MPHKRSSRTISATTNTTRRGVSDVSKLVSQASTPLEKYGKIQQFIVSYSGKANPEMSRVQFLQKTKLFPLVFRKKALEQEYLESRRELTYVSARYAGALCISAMILSTAVILILCISRQGMYLPLSDVLLLLSTAIPTTLILGLLTFTESIHKKLWSKGHAETVAVCLCAALAFSLAPVNVGIFWDSLPPFQPDQFESFTTILSDEFLAWMFDSIILRDWLSKYIFTFTLIFMFIVARVITIRSTWAVAANSLLTVSYIAGPGILAVLMYKYVGEWKSVLIEIMTTVIFFLSLAASSYLNDVSERITYLTVVASQKKIDALKDALEKKGTDGKKTSTAAEELVDIVETAKKHYEAAAPSEEGEHMVHLRTLSDVLHLLTHHEKLNAIHFDRVSAEKREDLDNLLGVYKAAPAKDHSSFSEHSTPMSTRSAIDDLQPLAPAVRAQHRPAEAVQFSANKLPAVLGCQFGENWDLDMLSLSQTQENILFEVGCSMLKPHLGILRTDYTTVQSLCWCICEDYEDNPYHNGTHGAFVCHAACVFVNKSGLGSSLLFGAERKVELIVAALAHDVGHPGRNNQYYIRIEHPLALLYNDKAPLENMHCSCLFTYLANPNCDIFKDSDSRLQIASRKNMITYILATDMSEHFKNISGFRMRTGAEDFDFHSVESDAIFTAKMAVKCADLGHTCVDWSQHMSWSLRVTEEFYQQGDDEAILGYVKSVLCDRTDHLKMAGSQGGFISFVVDPLLKTMVDLNQKDLLPVYNNLHKNKQRWQELADNKATPPIPEELLNKQSSHNSLPMLIARNLHTLMGTDTKDKLKDLFDRQQQALEGLETQPLLFNRSAQTSQRLLDEPSDAQFVVGD